MLGLLEQRHLLSDVATLRMYRKNLNSISFITHLTTRHQSTTASQTNDTESYCIDVPVIRARLQLEALGALWDAELDGLLRLVIFARALAEHACDTHLSERWFK